MICPLAVKPLSDCTFLARPKSVTRGPALRIQEHIGRLEVAVDHAPLVGVVHCLGDLLDEPSGFARR